MSQIIKDGQLIENNWEFLESLEEGEALPPGQIVVPVAIWTEFQSDIATRKDEVGVWLASDQDPRDTENIESAAMIAVKFDTFVDGRGFSIARLLRERLNYTGEIRAVGAPIRDQLTYMTRCGFNAFELADHYDPSEALASLKDFSENYQISVEQKTPLFRRRSS